jgi:protein-tyrosine phosphatase
MAEPVDKIKVLFVCMGNICRSPAAEGVFREYVRKAGHDALIQIDSAGTIDFHAGSLPDPRMRQAAARRGYRLDSLARQVTRDDFGNFDLIVAMDHINLNDLDEIAGGPTRHVQLLGSFLDGMSSHNIPEVPDPYYGGRDGFEKVLDMIESACPAMLASCLKMVNSLAR